jgi:ABC-type Na+ efflux pump permease subunit
MPGDALFIGRTDLASMLRQRETLLWVFLMPVLFFYFIGTVTGGFATSADPNRRDPLALAEPAGGGQVLEQIVKRLEAEGYRVDRPDTAEALARYARRLEVELPAGAGSLDEAVAAGAKVTVRLRRRGDALAANLDQVRVSRAVYSVLADLAVIRVDGQEPTAEAFHRLADMPRSLTLDVVPAGRRVEPPAGFAQAIPGTMVMFTMLVLLTSGSITVVIEREQGLLRRLASTPISRGSIVLGKWSARMALGLVQIGFAMVLGRLLFGMDWGATLPMVVAVLVAWAALNASLALLLANLARSQAQMIGIGVLSTMVLAALGGCWWPIEITPPWMQSLALALPTGWTMDAMHRLVSFGDPASAAVPHVGVLVASAALAGWLGARTFRYQ